MSESIRIPEGYQSPLGMKETQIAIKKIKDFFQRELATRYVRDTEFFGSFLCQPYLAVLFLSSGRNDIFF